MKTLRRRRVEMPRYARRETVEQAIGVANLQLQNARSREAYENAQRVLRELRLVLDHQTSGA